MKKLNVILLVAAMSFSLAACGGETSEPSAEHEEQLQSSEEAQMQKEIVFEEMTAVDNEACSVVLTGLEPDNLWGYTVNALLENKTSDKTYMFSLESASIDGVQCSDLFASEVAAGKKSNEDISLSDSELKENGVTDFSDIELSFRVYDSDDWSADAVARETIHIYPYGEENAVVFEREAQPEDVVLVDNEDITMILTGYEEDEIWGYTANLFLVNKTDKNIMFSVDDTSINGYMVATYFASTVYAGKCEFTSISWYDSELEENGITDVEEIEMNVRVYDEDNWDAEDIFNEIITLNP